MEMARRIIISTYFVCALAGACPRARAAEARAPTIQSLVKPAVYDRALHDRDIMTHASLDGDHYGYYATMLVQASLGHTREVLTDYALYAKMISYIDTAKYDAATHVLELSGGIFGYRLRSWVQFEEAGPDWLRYRIIRGNFTGMSGQILFEKAGLPGHPDETLVYLGGGLTQKKWPPKLIIERGAEIVFGFTARRMRSYLTKENKE